MNKELAQTINDLPPNLSERELAMARRELTRIQEAGRMSQLTGQCAVHVTQPIGAMAAALSIQCAAVHAKTERNSTVNVFVHGFGEQEAEAVLRTQAFLKALSEGKTAKVAMESAGLPTGVCASGKGVEMAYREALADLLGDLPRLAAIMTGRKEWREEPAVDLGVTPYGAGGDGNGIRQG